MDEADDDLGREDIVELTEGELVVDRWIVVEAIGNGAYGDVYHVLNKEDERVGAMKVESVQAAVHILKIELEVLKTYEKEGNTAMQLIGFGATDKFSFIVMTLCGQNLAALNLKVGDFSDSTLLRVALRSFLSLKELHEIGYVHRDIKPSNFAASRDGSKTIHLIDFGMTRLYAKKNKSGRWKLKKQRGHVAFRGTVRYCSMGMHERQEQGRVDDLWSWFYMCVEMRNGLSWRNFSNPDKVYFEKKQTTPKVLLGEDKILVKWEPVLKHLTELGYFDRPNYEMVVSLLEKQIKEKKIGLLDDYDWERDEEKAGEQQKTADKVAEMYKKFHVKKSSKPCQVKEPMTEAKIWERVQNIVQEKITDIPGGEEHCGKVPDKAGMSVETQGGGSLSVLMPINSSKPPPPSKQAKNK